MEKKPVITMPIVIQLDFPVTGYGETIREITMSRRLNVGDMKSVDGLSGIKHSIALAARLFAIPESTVEQLDMIDMDKIVDVLASFLE